MTASDLETIQHFQVGKDGYIVKNDVERHKLKKALKNTFESNAYIYIRKIEVKGNQ